MHQADLLKNESKASLLRVSVAPQFLKINPYQKQLFKHLEELEVQIQGIDPGVTYLPSLATQWEASLVHLHWLHKYFEAPNAFKALSKLSKFLIGLTILKLRGIKIVWTAHNLKDHENQYQLLDQVCTYATARFADSIIAHSEVAKQAITQQLKLKQQDKIHIIPHGNYIGYYENTISRQKARQSLGLPESSVVFLSFGLVRPYKGIIELINAFQQLEAENAYLVIAGKPLNTEFSELIKQAIGDNHTIKFFPEFIPDEQVQIYMNACNVVVFPYREFLTSGAVVLAMSFGHACITPRKGCMGELLDDMGAVLYNPDSEHGLLHAMRTALEKTEFLAAMGAHNYHLIEQFDWHRVAKMPLDVYQQSLNR